MLFNKNEKKVLPFVDGLTFPIEKIISHFKEFLLLICSASLISSILNYWLFKSFSCTQDELGYSCTYSYFRAIILLLFGWYLSAAVYNRWQAVFADGKKLAETFNKEYFMKDAKAGFILLLYLVAWGMVLGGLYWLNIRVPNKDWRIETAFFMAVSFGILVFLFALLNFSVFQHFFRGGRFFAINKTFFPIFDNLYKPFAWFMIYLLIVTILLKQVFTYVFYNQHFSEGIRFCLNSFSFSAVYYTIVVFLSASLFFQERDLFAEDK